MAVREAAATAASLTPPVWVGLIRTANLVHCVWRVELPRAPTRRLSDRGFFVANIKSQIKRIKTNEKARQRNKAVKSSLKTAIRKFREAADAGDTDKATVLLRDASRRLDKAASKGVIHKNQAANKKSAMAKRAESL
jgi:small subunit ribosomal protein S20